MRVKLGSSHRFLAAVLTKSEPGFWEPIALTFSKKCSGTEVYYKQVVDEVVDSDAIRWEQKNEEIATMQEEDEVIAQVFYWTGTADEMNDMPSLGTKLIPKEQAIQYGPEALAYWSRWDELSIR